MPNKIHITFNGREDQRIILPIISQEPEKLYYFIANIKNTKQKDEHMDFFYKNLSFLKTKLPFLDIIQEEVDYTDYIEVIQKISKIIKKNREENPLCEVFVNIGTGSNITALASTEAARLWNCRVFYVFSTKYDPFIEGARHKGEMIIIEPPLFPIKKPKEKFIKVLKLIDDAIRKKYNDKDITTLEKYIFKKQLIELLIKNGYLKLYSKHEDLRYRKSSYYMKINKRYLEPLEKDLNYIRISEEKRNKRIFITEKGKIILDIFNYLI